MQNRKDRRIRQWNKAVIKTAPLGQNSLPPAEVKAFTYDLSLGGARLRSVERFESGTVLRLNIELIQSRETVSLKGHVKWVKRDEIENVFELGVEFDHDTALTVTSLMKNLYGIKP
jgi:hypothetical protein